MTTLVHFTAAVNPHKCTKMKKRLLLVVSGGFLAVTAGAWCYVFLIIIKEGRILLHEPALPIVVVEFITAAALSWLGIVIFFYAIIKSKEE